MAENGFRQLGFPRINIFADFQRPEPLHLEINLWEHMLALVYDEVVKCEGESAGKVQAMADKLSLSVTNGGKITTLIVLIFARINFRAP